MVFSARKGGGAWCRTYFLGVVYDRFADAVHARGISPRNPETQGFGGRSERRGIGSRSETHQGESARKSRRRHYRIWQCIKTLYGAVGWGRLFVRAARGWQPTDLCLSV